MQRIKISLDGMKHYVERSFVFSGGEVYTNLQHLPKTVHDCYIVARVQSSDDAMNLFSVLDIMRAKYQNIRIHLYIPYFPYARQDRRCAAGDAHGLSVFCKTLKANAANVDKIVTYDVHSRVAINSINEIFGTTFKPVDQSIIVKRHFTDTLNDQDYVFVIPDKGAANKLNKENYSDYPKMQFLACEKTRDSSTGQLSGFKFVEEDTETLMDEYSDKHLVIVDDICDGGGTFIGLSELLDELKPKSKTLFTTHGIYSKGLTPFYGKFSHIICTNTFNNNLSREDLDSAFDAGVVYTQIKVV